MIAGKVANRITTVLEQQVTFPSKPRETRDPQLVSICRAVERATIYNAHLGWTGRSSSHREADYDQAGENPPPQMGNGSVESTLMFGPHNYKSDFTVA